MTMMHTTHTFSFLNISISARKLLCGNGALHAILVAVWYYWVASTYTVTSDLAYVTIHHHRFNHLWPSHLPPIYTPLTSALAPLSLLNWF
jgi:hypothetical protein